MVAGGTGITPMWQVANHILSDGLAERTQVSCQWLPTCSAALLADELLVEDHGDCPPCDPAW